MKLLLSCFSVIVLLLFSITACNDSLVGPDKASLDLEKRKPADTPGAAGIQLAPGEAQIVYDFADQPVEPLDHKPEGIAFDRKGNMFVSDRYADGSKNLILRISPTNEVEVLADLGPRSFSPECVGVLGLTTDPGGNVYAAFPACNENHGVWKVDRNGEKVKLAGSEQIEMPNALTFDARGNLYVTDSSAGYIFVYGKDKIFSLWLDHPLLKLVSGASVFTGVNGIAFYPPDNIYFVNNDTAKLGRVQIMNDGSAGTVEDIALTGPMSFLFLYPDGLSVDVHGNLYAAIPPAGTPPPPGTPTPPGGFPPFSPIVKVDPATGFVSPVVEPFFPGFPGSELFDAPTSLAFGTGPRDRKSLFVVSGDLFGIPGLGSGPAVTQVGVGTPGFMGQ